MRRVMLLAGILGTLISGLPPAQADTDVHYQGLRIPVPAGWQVHRLGPHSTDCLRFDRHAVYLGPAGENQLCPAHTVGRTTAIHVEPLTEQTRELVTGLLAGRGGESTGGPPGLRVTDPAAHEIRIAVPEAGALITGSYGRSEEDLERVLAGITVDRPPPEGAAERHSGMAHRHRWIRGDGFDTCNAPSLDAMQAWREDFVAANIYIGGVARSCPDGRLSHDWVAAVRSMGWRLIPTYVGPQAPCGPHRVRFTPDSATDDAKASAEDAVRRARLLGLRRHTPIYFDLEAYAHNDPVCRQAVLDFMDAWTKRLRRLGYVPGIYGSVASGIRDLAQATGIKKPTVVWFAHWDKKSDTRADKYMEDGWWPGHRRIKQYRGDHLETHGGYTLNIDNDAVDGYVR
ncbi:DUF1906 domain-containing protein [Actinoallomurus purpureus]|uniref:DUF1906 domain-containing protein n=1 Tax=Actinoallomurus purpureus TaxID=478114 RepID=UPI002092582A|nr:DUF1906 domain-containing protein [Actinoallomurus purpureus]MCO6006306.1 DUF1906 domain-containing protein [Actinoallomurus purpureus]